MTKHPEPRRGTYRSVSAAALALISLSTAQAASLYSLEPTVVVSTRTPLGMDRITASVDSIHRQEIERAQDRWLTDTISRSPGMILWSNGGIGNISSLSIRGTESNHSSIFIDGRRLSPAFGNEYDIGSLSPANASSVEIQRGPSSVQYGSSNIGGVIDTRLLSGLGLNGSEGAVRAQAGSNDYRRSGFNYTAGNELLGLSLSTSHTSTDNERENDAYQQSGLTSRFDYLINKNLQLELIATGFTNKKQLPGFGATPTPFDTQDTSNWLVSPGMRYLSDELSVHLFYSRCERNSDTFELNPAFDAMWNYLGDFPISNRIEVLSDEVNLQVDYSLPDHSLLSLGAVYRNDDILNTNINTFNPLDPPVAYDESFQQLGLYAQVLWMLSEDAELRMGLRHDSYSDYEDELTGNLILVHHLGKNTSLHAKVATSIAPPSAVDLAYDSDTSTPLRAESCRSYEFGARQQLLRGDLELSAVVFRNEIDDLLSYDPGTFDTFNIEEATIEGVEIAANYQATDKIELSLGYTYLRAASERLDDPRTGGFIADPASDVPLARRPRHLVQAGAYWRATPKLTIGLQAIAQFKREDINPDTYLQESAEDFMVFRLLSEHKLSESWSITGRIENLLDEQYASAAGYPALGRALYVGAKMKF